MAFLKGAEKARRGLPLPSTTNLDAAVALAAAGGAPMLAKVSAPTGTIRGLLWSKELDDLRRKRGGRGRKKKIGKTTAASSNATS